MFTEENFEEFAQDKDSDKLWTPDEDIFLLNVRLDKDTSHKVRAGGKRWTKKSRVGHNQEMSSSNNQKKNKSPAKHYEYLKLELTGFRQSPDSSRAETPDEAFEVYSALFQMSPLKSPGLDGFSPVFFQRKPAGCYVCGKINHKAKECFFSKAQNNKTYRSPVSQSPQVNVVTAGDSSSNPDDRHVKVNFDAAVLKDKGCCEAGVVICDHVGKMIVGTTEIFNGNYSPNVAKSLVARRAVEFAAELVLSGFWLEGDSQCVVTLLNSEDDYLSFASPIADEVKGLDLPCTAYQCVLGWKG
ncbi:hypothetical protein ACH5RR_033328 [Cinchona calisaya]|uniref:CCHC-type domain-containing protein n=1 Tax=Cinchona calisaya TaxID=153742 RepID=A0ABD2YLZ6_9GENT